jgi:hypothetical protein
MTRSIVSALAVSGLLGLVSLGSASPAHAEYVACAAPFDPANITSVQPYKVTVTNLRRSRTIVDGATITVAAQPGMTREWLQRLVDDPALAAQPGCPMSVNGATAAVRSTGNGFAITVAPGERVHDRDAAREILRRAEALPTSQRQ